MLPCPALFLIAGLARAQAPSEAQGDLHAGIAIADLQALHAVEGRPPAAPAFGTATTGWSLQVPEGIVFVYVGPTVDAAVAWTALQLARQRQPPVAVPQPVDGVEEAWRTGTSFYLLRDDNVGIMVQGTAEAGEEASLVRGLVQAGPAPWPAATPPTALPDGSWTVDAPDAVHVAWQGGRRQPGPELRWSEPPSRVVTWDALGRAATWAAEAPQAPSAAD